MKRISIKECKIKHNRSLVFMKIVDCSYNNYQYGGQDIQEDEPNGVLGMKGSMPALRCR